MLHPYDPYESLEIYRRNYTEQAGNGTKVFKGGRSQRGYGHGIGNFIGSITRRAVPFLKTVGKQLLESGIGLASDVIGGKSFKESAIARGKNMAGMAFNTMREALSEGMSKKTSSSPARTPAKKRRKASKKPITKKRRKNDIFDKKQK